MSEQRDVPPQSGSGDESPPATTGTDGEQHGKVRTDGETSVDEAIGTGDNVH
jgi:hypothetical protein